MTMDLASLPGGNGEVEPPDTIPNSEVKRLSADDSVGSPHVKVGHRQALNLNPRYASIGGFFLCAQKFSGGDLLVLIVGTVQNPFGFHCTYPTHRPGGSGQPPGFKSKPPVRKYRGFFLVRPKILRR